MNGKNRTRVLVGLSGGVDSSAAAALLLEQGFDVIGITLKLWAKDCVNRAEDKCCGPQAVTDARAVSHKLGIPFYLIDESAAFQQRVIDYFAAEYRAGRTPNPCVMCNQHLKFGALIDRADQLGAQFIATGHFARVERAGERSADVLVRSEGEGRETQRSQDAFSGDRAVAGEDARTPSSQRTGDGRVLLKRGRDPRKDQSYFLFSLRQDQLTRTLFPLGDKTKSDTREVARTAHLKTADKEESMEICFVPDNDYGRFLQQANLAQKHRGEIVDTHDRLLGHHDGVEFYTIGQRKGLGLSAAKPLYVIELDAANNRVIVGDDTLLARDEFTVERCNWIPFDSPPPTLHVMTKIRYNHPGTLATVTPGPGGRATVKLHVPQRAITPGQAAVFYQDELVLGGGWITR